MVTPTAKRKDALPPASTQLYGVGSVAGGALSGAFLVPIAFLLSVVPWPLRIGISIGIGIYGLLVDLSSLRLPRPGAHRQVPGTVLRYGGLGSFLFGFAMGTGAITFMSMSAPWVVAGMAALASPGVASLIGAGIAFGAARWSLHLDKWYSRDPDWRGELELLMGERPSLLRTVSSIAAVLAIVAAVMAQTGSVAA